MFECSSALGQYNKVKIQGQGVIIAGQFGILGYYLASAGFKHGKCVSINVQLVANTIKVYMCTNAVQL
jgi:hypothetical protein